MLSVEWIKRCYGIREILNYYDVLNIAHIAGYIYGHLLIRGINCFQYFYRFIAIRLIKSRRKCFEE